MDEGGRRDPWLGGGAEAWETSTVRGIQRVGQGGVEMRGRYGRHARYSTWVSVTHGDHINFNLCSGGHHCALMVSATRHRPQNECLNFYKFDSAQSSQRLKNAQTAPTKIIFLTVISPL